MLTLKDLSIHFSFLGFLSQICILPVRIIKTNGGGSWRMEAETRRWRAFIRKIHVLLFTLHTIFLWVRTVQAMVNFEVRNLRHFGCGLLCLLVFTA